MEFEWDDRKASENARTHGVEFTKVVLAFRDQFAIELIDDAVDYGEERTILLGMVDAQIVTVIYTQRVERIRIISARKATKHEQDFYYRENAL